MRIGKMYIKGKTKSCLEKNMKMPCPVSMKEGMDDPAALLALLVEAHVAHSQAASALTL